MKELYKQSRVEAAALFKKSMGVLIVLMVLFYALKNYVLYPLMTAIWNLAVSTVPGGYITEARVIMFLKYPYLLLLAVAFIVLYCILTVWELSAIMMCCAYYDQDRPVSLLRLFPLSLQNMKHLAKKGNWLFFVYILIILPYTDFYSASGMVSSVATPEYIADFFYAKPALYLLTMVAYVLLIWLCIRWFYSMQGVLVEKKDFKEARADSVAMIKGRMLPQILDVIRFEIVQFGKVVLIPFAVCSLIVLLIIQCTDSLTGEYLAMKIAFYSVYGDLFKLVASEFMSMTMMSYMIVNYRIFAMEKGIYQVPDLPESGDKKGKLHTFRHLGTVIYAGVTTISIVLFAGILVTANVAPEMLTYFNGTVMVAAHKGLSSQAPENTMDAFDKAYNSGNVNLIELDVRESKDGIPIVIHNASLKEACGVDKDVYDLDYEEIRSYKATYSFSEKEFPDAYVPTLEEVLAKYGGGDVTLLIEIKADDRAPDLPKKIVELIHEYGCTDSCAIHSGNYESLEAVKAEDESIPCGYIIAMSTGNYYNLPCADFFSVEHNFVNTGMIRKIHNLGKEVYVWTVNDQSSIEDMLMLDVDVVITDYPDDVHDEFYTNNDLVEGIIDSQKSKFSKTVRQDAKENYEEGNY